MRPFRWLAAVWVITVCSVVVCLLFFTRLQSLPYSDIAFYVCHAIAYGGGIALFTAVDWRKWRISGSVGTMIRAFVIGVVAVAALSLPHHAGGLVFLWLEYPALAAIVLLLLFVGWKILQFRREERPVAPQ